MLVAIGLVFSLQQDARQQRVEDQRAEAERELAEQRAQDEALQAYLDQMSQLILERKLLEENRATQCMNRATQCIHWHRRVPQRQSSDQMPNTMRV